MGIRPPSLLFLFYFLMASLCILEQEGVVEAMASWQVETSLKEQLLLSANSLQPSGKGGSVLLSLPVSKGSHSLYFYVDLPYFKMLIQSTKKSSTKHL